MSDDYTTRPDELVRRIGIMTLVFNFLEDALEMYLSALLLSKDFVAATVLIRPMSMTQKIDGILRVAKHYRSSGDFVNEDTLTAIKDITNRIRTVAANRNLVTHGLLLPVSDSDRIHWKMAKKMDMLKTLPLSIEEVSQIAIDARSCHVDLCRVLSPLTNLQPLTVFDDGKDLFQW